MYCENCGNKLESNHKFCTKCGHSNVATENKRPSMQQAAVVTNDKWWQRLLKVVYIFLYAQILWIVPVVWSTNSTSYSGYYGSTYHYEDTPGAAFWYSVLAIVIFVVVLRLIKLTVLYIAMGRKPEWKKEFKKLF